MDLKTRLEQLQHAAGKRTTPARAPGAQALPPAVEAPPPTVRPVTVIDTRSGTRRLAGQLGAQCLAGGLLYREEILAGAYRHGGQRLDEVLTIGPEPLGVAIPPPESGWLFFDTETTGLAGGSGTLVFLFGGVQYDGCAFRLRQWLLPGFAAEDALMSAVQQIFDETALLISFNGKSFDLPLLRTRHRMQRRVLREQHLTHLDLLHPARSAFSQRWPDVRLQTAERLLCAVHRQDDLPGAAAPLAFIEWLRTGQGADLARVMRHHRDDVLSLVTLTAALTGAYRQPASRDADEAGIVRRLRRRGYRVRAGQAQLAFRD